MYVVKRTIAGNDQEFIVVADLVRNNIRERSHYLLLGRKLGALLELEISDGSG